MATRTLNFLVGPDDEGLRLDVYLARRSEDLSRSACAQCIEAGCVTINTTVATNKSERVLMGDRIRAEVPVLETATGPLRPNPEIPLDIRFEDEHLIVLSKQVGLVCHPSPGHLDDTLANALVAHCGYEHLGMLQGEERPGIVHRLDMDTSGLMVAAKTDEAQKALQDLIRLRVLDRRYITLVHGFIARDTDTIVTGIARSTRDRLRMTVSDAPGAREAITSVRVLERFECDRIDDGFTLAECHLYTGRTHQIRVHMRHTGHPLVGDQLYGRRDIRFNRGLERQFLHSWSISFEHPVTGEQIALKDRLPDDLLGILEELSDRSLGRTAAGRAICPLLGVPTP